MCVSYCQNYADLQLHDALYFTLHMRYLEFSKKHSDLGVHNVVKVLIWLACLVQLSVTVCFLECQEMLLLGNHSIWSDEAIFLGEFVALTHDHVVGGSIPVQRNSLGVCQIPRHMCSQNGSSRNCLLQCFSLVANTSQKNK